MSEDSGDRTTLALVAAKIDGLKELQARAFSDMQQQIDRRLGDMNKQLDRLYDIPIKMGTMERAHIDLEGRVEDIEKAKRDVAEWKRGPLVMSLFGGVMVMIAVINLIAVLGGFHVG